MMESRCRAFESTRSILFLCAGCMSPETPWSSMLV